MKQCPWCGNRHKEYNADYHYSKCYKATIDALVGVLVDIEKEAMEAIGDTKKSRVAVGVIATKVREVLRKEQG